MKKLLILTVACCLAICSITDGLSNDIKKKEEKKSTDNNELKSFSLGLHYKNLATGNLKSKDKNKYFDLAIENFTRALSFGKSLHRIYYHISECYFFKYEFTQAIDYSEKSIKENNKFIEPYKLIYKIYLSMRQNNKAAEILERYLKTTPNNVFICYKLAEHYYLKMNNLEKSFSAFKKVIKLSKITTIEDYYKERAYYFMGYISYRMDKVDTSIKYFKKVLDVNHENLNAVYLLALLNMEQYNLMDAGKYSKIYLKKIPKDSMMLFLQGRIMYLKSIPGSIKYIREGKSLGSIEGWLAKGLYEQFLKQDQKAEEILMKIIKVKPDYIEPYLGMAQINIRKKREKTAFDNFLSAGILLYKKKLYFEAINCFRDAIDLNDKVAGVYYYMGRAYEELKNYSLAIVYFKEAYELKTEPDLLLHLGYLHAIKKDYALAFEIFDKVLIQNPKDAKPYFFRGLVSLWKKDYPYAEENIKRAISIDDKSETYYFYLAIVLEKQSRIDEAVTYLEKAIQYNPKSARSYNYLGYLYADKNIKIDRSLFLIKKALEIEPENGAYVDSLGWAYYRKGKYHIALENLLKAEMILDELETPDPIVYDHIGDTYEKLKNFTKAIQYWEKALKIKDDEKIKNKIQHLKKENKK